MDVLHEKPKELVRTTLENTLNSIIDKPFVVIAAPSGYGKTTLVKCFFRNNNHLKTIWFSLGKEEVDESWAWKRFCEKFKDKNQEMYERMSQLSIPRSSQEMDYFFQIIERYLIEPTYMIIDDFHECSSSDVNRLITRLVYEEMPFLHIVLISRTHPDLPYEEMFLNGYCAVLDQTNLTLDREETGEIFRINQVSISQEELDHLYEYTDGWIAAAYLALYEYKKTGGLKHSMGINRLLKTAIFDKLPPVMKEIYMKMSLFDKFTAEDARYVTGTEFSEQMLHECVEQYGFMHYDRYSKRFMMHSLLRATASSELDKTNIDRLAIYRAAGMRCEEKGEYVSAVLYYRKAKDWDRVLRLYSGEWRNIIMEMAPVITERIFEEAAEKDLKKYPVAWLCYIYYVVIELNALKGRAYFEKTWGVFENMEETEHTRPIKGELMIVRSLLEFNDLKKVNNSMKEASRLLTGGVSRVFKQSLLTYGTPCMTLLYYSKPGSLCETIELEKEYAKYHMEIMGGGKEGWEEFFDAEYALIKGEVQKAFSLAETVCEKAVFRDQTCVVISSYYIMFRCLIYLGKPEKFEQKMKEFLARMEGLTRPILITDMELAYSYAYACLGWKDKMAKWVKNFELSQCSRVIRTVRSGCVTYGIMLSRLGQWKRLQIIGDQLLVPYENTSHTYLEIRGYIFRSIAAYHLESVEKAREYLEKAVEKAQEDDVKIPFIENSLELTPIIERVAQKNAFLASMKPDFKQYEAAWKRFSRKTEKPSLTDREKELMQYVKEGYRNVQISEKMHVALVTVEKNLTNVYRKLNVANRAGAIAKMEEMKL